MVIKAENKIPIDIFPFIEANYVDSSELINLEAQNCNGEK